MTPLKNMLNEDENHEDIVENSAMSRKKIELINGSLD